MKAGSHHTKGAKEKMSLAQVGLKTGDKHPQWGKLGADAAHWRGGKKPNGQGYVLVLAHGHPQADHKGYVREHRLIVEKGMKRFLRLDEIVHHWNGIRDDNRAENLAVMDPEAHKILHAEERKRARNRV